MILYYNTYKQRYEEYSCYEYWMLADNDHQYRRLSTQQERKRWYKDREENVKLRGRRSPGHLDPWDIEKRMSCFTTKSWKKLYKKKRQWQ